MATNIEKEEFDFNQVQEKRKKMYFREDGFIALNEVIVIVRFSNKESISYLSVFSE
jgi:hypothetical protein